MRQKRNGQARISQKYPYHNAHYIPGKITSIQPNSIFIRCSYATLPRIIVEIISVVSAIGPFVVPRSRPKTSTPNGTLRYSRILSLLLFEISNCIYTYTRANETSRTLNSALGERFQSNRLIILLRFKD